MRDLDDWPVELASCGRVHGNLFERDFGPGDVADDLHLLAAFVDLDGEQQGDVPVMMIGTLETRVSVSELRDLLEKIR